MLRFQDRDITLERDGDAYLLERHNALPKQSVKQLVVRASQRMDYLKFLLPLLPTSRDSATPLSVLARAI
jgi:hypothetical protein